MATLRQKTLAQNIVKNAKAKNKLNKRDLLVSSGYALITAESVPSKIMEQKGVIKELKHLGFNSDTAKKVVAEILENPMYEASERLAAAREVFKVHGDYAAEKQVNLNVSATAEQLREQIQQSLQAFRK